MPRQVQNGNPVLTAKSAWGISQRRGLFPRRGFLLLPAKCLIAREEPRRGAPAERHFQLLILCDSETVFGSLGPSWLAAFSPPMKAW